MQVTTEKREGGKIALTINLEPGALPREVERVYRELGQRLSIPGFRPGKVPRALLERQVEPEAAQAQAIERLVDEAYPQALDQAGLEPLEKAELESAQVQEDGSLLIKATVTARPEVQLGQYRELTGARRVPAVTPEQVQAELDRLRGRDATFREVRDRPIKEGDLVVVDYDLHHEGALLEGKGVQGYPLEVGQDRIFPELNEALAGAGPGQEVRFSVSYPANLPDQELAGKTVEVVATPRSVRERTLPEAKETAQRLGAGSVHKLETTIRETLEAMAQRSAEQELEQDLLRQVVEASYVEAPEPLVERELASRLAEAEQEVARQQVSLDDYLRRQGVDPEQWRRQQMVEARSEVKRALIVDEIGRREQIEVTPEEVEAEVEAIAQGQQQPAAQVRRRLERSGALRRLVNRIYQHKIIRLLVDSAQVTEQELAPEPAPEGQAGPEQ